MSALYPTFTMVLETGVVRWLGRTFAGGPSIDDVTVEVHRDEVVFTGCLGMDNLPSTAGTEPETSSVVVRLTRDNIVRLRTRVAGSVTIDVLRFAELSKMAPPRAYAPYYRFRMDGDGVLFVGAGRVTRAIGLDGTPPRRPDSDFATNSVDLRKGVVTTANLETEW